MKESGDCFWPWVQTREGGRWSLHRGVVWRERAPGFRVAGRRGGAGRGAGGGPPESTMSEVVLRIRISGSGRAVGWEEHSWPKEQQGQRFRGAEQNAPPVRAVGRSFKAKGEGQNGRGLGCGWGSCQAGARVFWLSFLGVCDRG